MKRVFSVYLMLFSSIVLFGQKTTFKTYFKQSKKAVEKEFEGRLEGTDTIKNGSYKHFFEYSNGIYEEGSYQNNKKHGLFITFYENGKKHWVRSYQNGILFGNEEYYNINEYLLFSGFYQLEENKTEGLYQQFYDNENLKKTVRTVENQYDGKEINFYISGDTSSLKTFNSGILNGLFKIYNEAGILWQKGTYKSGLLTDTLYTFYENGKLKSKGAFKNGVPNGKMYDYHLNQKLKRDCFYVNDTLNGKCFTYYDNEQLLSEVTFFKGHFDKVFLEYYKDGTVKDSISYKRSAKHGISKHFNETGKLVSLENFNFGLYHGHVLSFYPSGITKKDYNYDNGIKIGKNYSYHTDGQLESILIFDEKNHVKQEQTFFENGKIKSETKHKYKEEKDQEGKDVVNHYASFMSFHTNGKKKAIGLFINDKKVGEWKEYYSNKAKKEIKNYKFDRLHGEYLKFHENKKKSVTGKYVSNKKTGIWLFYTEDGNLQKKENYKRNSLNGEFYELTSDGTVIKGAYLKGLKQGDWSVQEKGKDPVITTYKKGKKVNIVED